MWCHCLFVFWCHVIISVVMMCCKFHIWSYWCIYCINNDILWSLVLWLSVACVHTSLHAIAVHWHYLVSCHAKASSAVIFLWLQHGSGKRFITPITHLDLSHFFENQIHRLDLKADRHSHGTAAWRFLNAPFSSSSLLLYFQNVLWLHYGINDTPRMI